MTSLKKYSERLAKLLNTTPAALYERMRELVRLGLLKAPDRTGPGGGIRATPDTVAMLLLSCLATDNLSEISAQVGKFARIKPRKDDPCQLTGASSLVEALMRILSDRDLARRVADVAFYRQYGMAIIYFGAHKGAKAPVRTSVFGFKEIKPSSERIHFQVRAFLDGELLQKIADDLQQEQ